MKILNVIFGNNKKKKTILKDRLQRCMDKKDDNENK